MKGRTLLKTSNNSTWLLQCVEFWFSIVFQPLFPDAIKGLGEAFVKRDVEAVKNNNW